MEYHDLSYHKALPAKIFSYPRYLVSEITNEIEFTAGFGLYDCVFEYSYSKICEALDLHHIEAKWASGLPDAEISVINKFNIDMDYVKFSEIEKLENIDNVDEVDFHVFLIELLGGTLLEEEFAGIVQDNKFYKTFSASSFFELELSMHMSGIKSGSVLNRDLGVDETITKDMVEDIVPYIKKFTNIKRHTWDNLLVFPDTPRYEKAKFWIMQRLQLVKKELIKFIEKEGL